VDKYNLAQLMDEYITYKDVRKITKESYRRIFSEYMEYVNKLPKPPTREDVKTYREELSENLAATTVQKHMVVIRGFYEWLYAEGKGENIAIGIKGVKTGSNFKRQALSVDQASRLIEHARNISDRGIVELRNYAIIGLMITTGLRTIEVSRADSQDIMFVNDAESLFVRGKGRDAKDEYVKLPEEIHQNIVAYQIARSDNKKPLFINHNRNCKNDRISPKTISTMVKEYLRDVGIDERIYTAHSLRHTVATVAMNEGATLYQTQQLLRHKSSDTTQIYLHSIQRRESFVENLVYKKLYKKSEDKEK